MAHFWIPWQTDHPREEGEGHSVWAIARLPDDAGAFVLADDPRQPVRLGGNGRNGSEVARVLRVGDREKETWVLQSPERGKLRVNGLPLVAGMRVVEDLDEVWANGTGRIFFSTERTPKVEAFPGKEGDTPCARCKEILAKGEPSVLCPGCNTWYHQTKTLPCWEYSEKCALCDQLTCLDTGLRWTPENL